jgi:hypothetical protein
LLKYIGEWEKLIKSPYSNDSIRTGLEFCHDEDWYGPGKYQGCQPSLIGKLSFKEEAAGKLRVFAMVDVLTQSMFKPLHKELFSLFRMLPNDGTHDQNASFQRVIAKSLKANCSYGYDLSSATDRLPVRIQAFILNVMTHSNLGDLWQTILVDRPYRCLSNPYGIKEGDYYYKVGQPMGALSS